jgi:hypothetical protein
VSKRKEADAAYERVEDQRALALIVSIAEVRAHDLEDDDDQYQYRCEIEAAIARVKANILKITTPAATPTRELPGQLAIDGSVAGEPVRELGAPMAEAFDVPKQCPACGDNMLLVWGGSWNPMMRGPGAAPMLQCGHCAHVVEVSEAAYEAVLAERRRTVGATDKTPHRVARPKRERGAG